MRDPAARLSMQADRVVRELRAPLTPDHFLNSSLARRWREQGDLVDFEILDDRTVSARRLPFVSLPPEWCDLQLFQAAELTLRLQHEAVVAGFDLKDASAWNVIFDGGRPVFCDLLSFEPLTAKRWWAAGQFARHFILPLLLSQRRGLPVGKAFQAWRDGVPHDVAQRMLGPGRFLTRYWPLTVGSASSAQAPETLRGAPKELEDIRRFRASLNQSLDWMLRGVDPAKHMPDPSTWGNYVSERSHYTVDDLTDKRRCLQQWLSEFAPRRVLDLGCNSGEFSRLAASSGATVVAVDLDAGAIARAVSQPSAQISFLVAQLDDLRGGFGWNGGEHAGLQERLRDGADLVMILALIHHLVLGASIPLTEVASFARSCSRRWVVIEFIAPDDRQIGVMQTQRNREDAFPSVEAQRQAFEAAGLRLQASQVLPAGTRVLALMERTA